jgi:hypothetical protein
MSSDEISRNPSHVRDTSPGTDSGSRLFSRETEGPKPLPIIEPPPVLAVTVPDQSRTSTKMPSESDFVAKVYNTVLFVLVMAGT